MIGSAFVLASFGAMVLAQGAQSAPPATQPTTAPKPTASAARPMLVLGGIVVRPDETRKGWVGNGGPGDFEGYVWGDADLCAFGADGKEPASMPYVGWHMKGHVVSRTVDGLAAQIDWQRIWDNGVRITDGARGSMQVSMRNGESLQLDVAKPASDRCNTQAMRLEAIVADRAEWLSVQMMPFGQTGYVTTRFKPTLTKFGKVGTSGVVQTPEFRTRPRESLFWNFAATGVTSTERFDIEIWLVQTLANGTESAQRIALQAVQGGSRFAFPAVPVASSSGQANVEFAGNVSVMITKAGQELVLNLARTILVNGTGQTSQSGVKRIAMPAPSDVTSFELPPLTDAERALVGDQRFSIRVKIVKSMIGSGGKE